MTPFQELRKDGILRHFLKRIAPSGLRVSVLEAPFEELDELRTKRARKGQSRDENRLHAMASDDLAARGLVRADDNYLYSTRRFPGNTANNTIGGGTLTNGANTYFTTGINDSGTACGYFSLAQLGYQQTNMGPKGQIPKGQGYEMYELGLSFNAQASSSDIAQLLDVANITFNMQQGAYLIYQGPIIMWPGGTGLYGYATTTATTTTIQGASNGMPSPTSTRKLTQPRVFAPTDMFQYDVNVTANLPNSNTAVALSAFLELRIQLFGMFLSSIPQ